MTKQTRLSVEQYVKVTDWLRQYKPRIEKEEMTQLEAAQTCSDELEFEVPITTIQRCAKMAGVVWAKSPPKPQPVPIERDAIMILIGAISGLYIETGRSVPQALADLKSAYARETANKTKNTTVLDTIIRNPEIEVHSVKGTLHA